MTFNGPELAPAIFTPAELRKILAVCPAKLLPHIVIGAFSGIRAAEIERLDWRDILWDRGYIEIKAAKAKTKARRLVPLLPNLRAWLEPMRKAEGPVCFVPNLHFRLNYLGRQVRAWAGGKMRCATATPATGSRTHRTPRRSRSRWATRPDKLFRHYRELVTPDAAKEWFAIMPPAKLT